MPTIRKSFRPQIECLDRRDVPAALAWSLADGELLITGSAGGDGVSVYRQDDKLAVYLGTEAPADGVTYFETLEFDLSRAPVNRLLFTGLGGNDQIVDNFGLPLWADLGAGDDWAYVLGDSTIHGGAGDDRIFMSRDDPNHGTLYADGGAGWDYLVGGDHGDTLLGGTGTSSRPLLSCGPARRGLS